MDLQFRAPHFLNENYAANSQASAGQQAEIDEQPANFEAQQHTIPNHNNNNEIKAENLQKSPQQLQQYHVMNYRTSTMNNFTYPTQSSSLQQYDYIYDQHRRQAASLAAHYQHHGGNHPDFFAEKAPWYERLPCGPNADHDAPLSSIWVCAANPVGRLRQFFRTRIARSRQRLNSSRNFSLNAANQNRNSLGNPTPNSTTKTAGNTTNNNRLNHHSHTIQPLASRPYSYGATWMVSASGFVETSSVGAPLKPAGADVVACYMVGGNGGEALIAIYVNNKMAIYNLMNKNYIPTTETILPIAQNSVPTCASYDPETMTCLIGTNRGIIIMCQLDEGLNSMKNVTVSDKTFADNIACLKYLPKSEIILATNSYFTYVYDAKSLVVTQQYPSQSQTKGSYSCIEVSPNEDRLFMGTSAGTVEIIDHNKGRCILTSTLPGHKSQITAIHHMPEKSLLFTGDKYGYIQMWHMQAGFQMINLFYHSYSILDLHTYYHNDKLYLASLCGGNYLVHWDLTRQRNPPVVWNEKPECETCTRPFFWNIKKLWALKQVLGSRRHHCRSCGKSLCINCVAVMDRIPHYGLETQSNACFDCKSRYRDEDLQTTITILKPEDSKLALGQFSSFNDDGGKTENALITLSSSFFQKINVMKLKHL